MASQTYYEATAVAAPERPALRTDLDCEVVVIGGGFAGLWTALSLARRGRDVVVLEAGRLGQGASGRNGGFVAPGYAARLDTLIARVGRDHARALIRLTGEGAAAVRRLVEETAMPGVDPVPGRLTVYRHAGAEDAALRGAERLAECGVRAEAWFEPQVREALRSERYFAAVHLPDAFHLHPLNLLRGLAAAAERAGVRICEDTPVADADLGGVRKLVTTPKARLRCHDVALCGNAGLAAFPDLARTVLPVATHVAVTAPLGERLAEAIRFPGAVADTRRAGDYYRIVGDRLLWGGRISTRTGEPRRLGALIKADMVAVFPQLAEAEIAYAWTGVMGYAVHEMPQIGRLAPGVWIASAFGGHGLAPAAAAGELIATAMLDGDDRWRLFIPFGLVPAAGAFGRLLTQFGYWRRGWHDRLDEARARKAAKAAAAQSPPPSPPPPSEPPSEPPPEASASGPPAGESSGSPESSSRASAAP